MHNYFSYLIYVLRHKWFVFLECCKLGIPWLGIMHDMSRFRLSEFLAYSASAPYNKENKPPEIAETFTYAWNDHQRRNKHHWEYWVHFDYHTHEMYSLQIPIRYCCELIADWRGAGIARGTPGTWWYENNRDKIKLHSVTRKWIEEQLGL